MQPSGTNLQLNAKPIVFFYFFALRSHFLNENHVGSSRRRRSSGSSTASCSFFPFPLVLHFPFPYSLVVVVVAAVAVVVGLVVGVW